MAREPAHTPAKRLQTLEAQLAKEKEKNKALGAERSELERRLQAAEKSVQRLETATAAAAEAEAQRQAALSEAQKRFALPRPTLDALVTMAGGLVQDRAAIQKQLEGAQAEFERRTAEAETRAAKAEAALADSRKQIEVLQVIDDTAALIAENRRIAAQLESVMTDFETFRDAALKAEAAIKQAREETDKAVRAELEGQFAADRARLEKQVLTLTSQLQEQGKTPLISPESAARLVDDFVKRLREGLGGLRVKDGEIKLKVAFGQVGEHTGFVIPTAESDPELKENLHEVVLHFDQVKP